MKQVNSIKKIETAINGNKKILVSYMVYGRQNYLK